nr:MAG TPA: pentapeptide repeat protein [Caudoviricetes sp.]
MTQEKLNAILENHKKWLEGNGGERANLKGANLRGADLSYANLCDANLCGADLCGADLRYANLCGANLCGAYLRYANLCGADLRYANLCGANLCGVRYNEQTAYYAMQCPEKGAYIGYKKAEGKIVELVIQADAKRSSATTRKCRASKAKVLSITSIDGKEHFEEAKSSRDQSFVYRVGETVEVKDFDEDRWNECSTGIHHFITREEAERY